MHGREQPELPDSRGQAAAGNVTPPEHFRPHHPTHP